jgi:hypothetical protein
MGLIPDPPIPDIQSSSTNLQGNRDSTQLGITEQGMHAGYVSPYPGAQHALRLMHKLTDSIMYSLYITRWTAV